MSNPIPYNSIRERLAQERARLEQERLRQEGNISTGNSIRDRLNQVNAGQTTGNSIRDRLRQGVDPIEAAQKLKRSEILSGFNLNKGSIPYAIGDLGIGAVQDIGQMLSDPGTIAEGIESVGSNLFEMVKHPIQTTKSLGLGIVDQFTNIGKLALEALPGIDNLSPDEQNRSLKQSFVDVGAWFLGAKMFQGSIKGTKVARDIAKISAKEGLEVSAKVFAELSPVVRKQALQLGVGETRKLPLAIRGGLRTAVGAGVPGFFYGETPEERVSNMFTFGVVGGALGAMGGVIKAGKNARSEAVFQNFKDSWAKSQLNKLNQAVPESFGEITDLDGLVSAYQEFHGTGPTVKLLKRALRTSAQEQTVFPDLPGIRGFGSKTIRTAEGLIEYEIISHQKLDGKITAIVAPEGKTLALDTKQVRQFQQTGFYELMPVEYAGGQASVMLGGIGKQIKILTSKGVEIKVDPSKLVYANGRTAQFHPSKVNLFKDLTDLGFDGQEAYDVIRTIERVSEYKHAQVNDIGARAANAGFDIDYTGNVIKLTDPVTKEIWSFDNPKAIDEFIGGLIENPTGDLLALPQDAVGQLANTKISVSPTTKGELRVASANLSQISRWGIEPIQYLGAIQTLFPDIPAYKGWMGLNEAGRRTLERIRPYYNLLDPILDRIRKSQNLNNDIVATYMGTASRQELGGTNKLTRLFRGRDINPIELADEAFILDKLKSPAELSTLSKTMLDAIIKSAENDLKKPEEILATFQRLSAKTLTPEQVEVGTHLFQQRAKFSGQLDNYSALAPIELARSVLNETLSKADFAKKYNLSPDDIKTLDSLRDWFETTGTTLHKIPEKGKLNHYFPKVFAGDPDYIPTMVPEEFRYLYTDSQFEHALHRVGVVEDYISDIGYSTKRYVQSGVRSEILDPAIKDFMTNVVNPMKKR